MLLNLEHFIWKALESDDEADWLQKAAKRQMQTTLHLLSRGHKIKGQKGVAPGWARTTNLSVNSRTR